MTNSAIASFIRYGDMLRGAVMACLLLLSAPGAFGTDGTEDPALSGGVFTWPSVSVHPVTLKDQVIWSVQAVLAPKRLKAGAPLYAYPVDDALKVLNREGAADVEVGLNWLVGSAVRDGEGWKAYPVPAKGRPLYETAGWLECLRVQLSGIEVGSRTGVEFGEECPYGEISGTIGPGGLHVVSNLPLAGLDVEKRLWIPKEAWTDALKAFGTEEMNEVRRVLTEHQMQFVEEYDQGSTVGPAFPELANPLESLYR